MSLNDMGKEINKELTILFISALLLVGLGVLGVMHRVKQEKTLEDNQKEEFPWDYQINLHHDSIHIVTDYGDTLTIHADSLQSFIEEDNL